MDTAQRRAIDGAALAPLSAEEKRRLACLAREAWVYVGKPGWAEQDEDLPADIRLSQAEAFELWRHTEVRRACDAHGLRQCRHEDYNLVKSHFLRMLGRDRDADRAAARGATEPRRQAYFILRREMARVKDAIANPEAYVGAIAKSKFKTTMIETDLSENQLWTLVFDLRRAAQKRRTAVEGVPF